MAALPYMQLYIADYLADTMHLSAEEHGAYLLLMFNYWQTGKPIPKSRLAKIARVGNERWIPVEESLREFFVDNGTEWMHERIEQDLEIVLSKIEQRSAAGKASVAKRQAKKEAKPEREVNGRSSVVESPLKQTVNGDSTNKNKNKDLNTDPPLSPPRGKRETTKFDPLQVELPEWLPPELWREWVEYRRQLKKPIKTQQGVSGALNKLIKFREQGYSTEVVIRGAMENEWRGLYEPSNSQVTYGQNIPGSGKSLAERQLDVGREQWLREQPGGYSGMAPVGADDQNLQQSLDCEEWQSTVGYLGAADWDHDQ